VRVVAVAADSACAAGVLKKTDGTKARTTRKLQKLFDSMERTP
jgi:hypothetical protein